MVRIFFHNVHGAATSLETEGLARRLGIPLISLEDARTIHLAIDGVDAIDPDFYSIKGGGGALFREKIIACKARRVLWIMDQSKLVHSMSGCVLPVEMCIRDRYSRPSSIYRCQLIIGKPGFHMAFQTPEKDIHTIIVSPSRILSQHELFRIQIISVHKA